MSQQENQFKANSNNSTDAEVLEQDDMRIYEVLLQHEYCTS
jgi:hypothetical protein